MRLNRPPSVIVNGAAIALFVDPHDPASYMRGILWVGIDPADPCKVTWTEGVKKKHGSDAVDLDGLRPSMRDLYERTMQARTDAGPFAQLPRIEPGEPVRRFIDSGWPTID